MNRAERARPSALSLLVVAALLGACEIEGVTPNCSDAGECFTPPGESNPGIGNGGAADTNGGAGSSSDDAS
jgi:hypothetical protein